MTSVIILILKPLSVSFIRVTVNRLALVSGPCGGIAVSNAGTEYLSALNPVAVVMGATYSFSERNSYNSLLE